MSVHSQQLPLPPFMLGLQISKCKGRSAFFSALENYFHNRHTQMPKWRNWPCISQVPYCNPEEASCCGSHMLLKIHLLSSNSCIMFCIIIDSVCKSFTIRAIKTDLIRHFEKLHWSFSYTPWNAKNSFDIDRL